VRVIPEIAIAEIALNFSGASPATAAAPSISADHQLAGSTSGARSLTLLNAVLVSV
jgi:hypothetical protein